MNKVLKKDFSKSKGEIKEFILEHKYIILIMGLLFLQRIYAMFTLGVTYNLSSDDLSYVTSGIVFKNTGTITMHGYLSGQIMPGMPVLIGFVSLIFGEGKWLWLALKILWFIMNSFSAFFIYKIVTLYTPKWCGILAAIPLFWADFVWMDNLILTETPFLVLFIAMIYFTLMMGRTREWRYFWLCAASYMLALMFKANIGVYPIFAFVYLIAVKYDFMQLLKQCGILACIVLCFIIPWSIRNYVHYDAFVPLTWGAGNPMLLGTYQGEGNPLDEDLDYEKNVEEVAREKFAKYYDEEGNIVPDYMEGYISLEKDGIMAKYRMKVWAQENPKSMFKSYFIDKPKNMIHSSFYWSEVFNVPIDIIMFFRDLNWKLCIITLLASLFVKKYRSIILFIAALYIGNIYIYAMTFSFSRYAATLLPLRFIILGIGIMVVIDLIKNILNRIKKVKII
ncbi:MAG: glycosyltransferase family 39 protein [Clostridium sp.]